jgi:septal ring factor EnvC (AmiA/AmiB activator)
VFSRALVFAAFSLGAAAAFAEETPNQKLKAVEKALEESRQSQEKYTEEAEAVAAEIEELRQHSVEAAKAEQDTETAISAIESDLAELGRDEAAKTEDLRRRGVQSAELLMALQRLAREPPEALALSPGDPADTARGALLLGTAIPEIEAKARELRSALASLAVLRSAIAEKRRLLVERNEDLGKQELALKTLTTRKTLLQERASRGAEISAQRLAQLSVEATDLRELIMRLEAERQKRAEEQQRIESELLARASIRPPRPPPQPPTAAQPPPTAPQQPEAAPPGLASTDATKPPVDVSRPKYLRPFAAAHGAMRMPVAGKIKLRFGEPDEFGAASKGLVIESRSGGQVVAPFDGRIEFAGPFRGYGQILIIEHSDGYHSLLAGLDRIDGAVGQWLVAGEPVGLMPIEDHGAALYMELRFHGQPINPSPWLATRDDKVSG